MKLYRGFSQKFQAGKHKNQWLEVARQPKDTSKDLHHKADVWFTENFGVAARSRTIICSTNIEQAKSYAEYGCLMEIVPESPYQLIYSKNVIDFLNIATEPASTNVGDVHAWLSNQNYLMVDNVGLIQSDFAGEVMVHCDYYQATLIE